MLNLDEKEWSELSHAYGTAEDIPDLISQLSEYPINTDYKTEPYFTLCSSLCHQGDIYTASYAAVPHILLLAEKKPTRISFDYLLIPVSIEIARLSGRGPDIPKNLRESCVDAIHSMPRIVGLIPVEDMDKTKCLVCAAAIAVAAGNSTLAEAILELEGDAAKDFLQWKFDQ